jgi:hypothetical protein
MSKINVDTWEPESGTAATLMASGDTVTVPSGASLVVASGATINITGATQTGFPTGGLLGLVKYTGDGTYTKGGTSNGTAGDEGNASVTKVIVEVQGGGGSGNREDATDILNCAGGGGGYAKKFLDLTNIDTVTVTVGTGGAGQASDNNAGNDGGISSFVKATGSGSFTDIIGNPGIGGNNTAYTPAEGGTATGGDFNVQGGVGAYQIHGAPAGGSILGNFGVSMTSTALTNGRGYGTGGGSGRSTTSGAGAPGIILIWEYA